MRSVVYIRVQPSQIRNHRVSAQFPGSKPPEPPCTFTLTSKDVNVDGDGVSEAGGARVCARVGGARVLHHEEGGRHLVALVRDHAHAAARRVVRDYLKQEGNTLALT